jgi:hypothetical protein
MPDVERRFPDEESGNLSSNTQLPPNEKEFPQKLPESEFLVNLKTFLTAWQSFINSETQRPTVERSPQLSEFYRAFSGLLAMIPEINQGGETNQGGSQDTEADGVKVIQVGLTPVYNINFNIDRSGRYTIAPIYILPDGTKIEFRSDGYGSLEPIIVPSGQYIFSTDHEKNIGRIREIINQIRQDLGRWRLAEPSLEISDSDKEIILKMVLGDDPKAGQVLKVLKFSASQDPQVVEAAANIPNSVREYLPSDLVVPFGFYPELQALIPRPRDSIEELRDYKRGLITGGRLPISASGSRNLQTLVNYAKISIKRKVLPEEGMLVLPTGYKDYSLVVHLERQTDQATVTLNCKGKSPFQVLAEIMQADEEGLTIEFSKEFYDAYRRRISKELQALRGFIIKNSDSPHLKENKSLREELVALLSKITRSLRPPDLLIWGSHLRGLKGSYSVNPEVQQAAEADLSSVQQLLQLIESNDWLSSLMIATRGRQALKLTDYLTNIVSIMTDLKGGRISSRIKNLLRGETNTGALPTEEMTQMQIIDISGGPMMLSYKGVIATINLATLELTIDISSGSPKYTLKIGSRAVETPAEAEARRMGLGWLLDAHIDGPIAILADGRQVFLPGDRYYCLDPSTDLVVFSQEEASNRDKEVSERDEMQD